MFNIYLNKLKVIFTPKDQNNINFIAKGSTYHLHKKSSSQS